MRGHLRFKETPEICYPRWSFWLIWDEMFPDESYEITDPSQYCMIYDRDISLYDDVFPEKGDYRQLKDLPRYKITPSPADWKPPRSSEARIQTNPPVLAGLSDVEIAQHIQSFAEVEGLVNVKVAIDAYLQDGSTRPYPLVVAAYKENGLINLKHIEMFIGKLVKTFNWSIEHALTAFNETLIEAQWSFYEGLSNYLDFLNSYYEDHVAEQLASSEEEHLRNLLDLFREEDTRQYHDPLV